MGGSLKLTHAVCHGDRASMMSWPLLPGDCVAAAPSRLRHWSGQGRSFVCWRLTALEHEHSEVKRLTRRTAASANQTGISIPVSVSASPSAASACAGTPQEIAAWVYLSTAQNPNLPSSVAKAAGHCPPGARGRGDSARGWTREAHRSGRRRCLGGVCIARMDGSPSI